MANTLDGLWKFVAGSPGEESDLLHRVLCAESDTPLVTTWSHMSKHPDIGGFSWHGPLKDFLKQFRKCAHTSPPSAEPPASVS